MSILEAYIIFLLGVSLLSFSDKNNIRSACYGITVAFFNFSDSIMDVILYDPHIQSCETYSLYVLCNEVLFLH